MAETEEITVATTSAGVGGSGEPGRSVDLPVVELLTGRGFVTGKSGSGKSNTASVIAEKLLDNGFGLLVVDIDGEYYGLKEEYEILHVGADEECDIQVTVEHAEKIASLALEENVPIILDISSFLDQDEAEELLTEVSRQLFAKAKKQKQPFLMLVEECHEWIPEKGSVGEVGQMLIKIGKRGRKHGLGMVGISQRPADVKKDYITQCDWLVWHRLTWNNDTKVVGRIIDNEYADAVEDLDDGEAFLMTDWSETIRRVQFHRKQTFDAGATPGLDDFERPELKSVSDDLVSELTEISEEKQQTADRIKELREELDKKNSRIAELEKELQDARDLQRMAEQFTAAMVEHVEGYNPGRTEQERMRQRRLSEISANESGSSGSGEARSDGGAVATVTPPLADPSSDGADDTSAAETDDGVADGAAADGEASDDADEDDAEEADRSETDDERPDAEDEPVDGADESDGEEADAETDEADDEDEPADRTSGGGFGDAFGNFVEDGPAIAGGADAGGADDGDAAAAGGSAKASTAGASATGVASTVKSGHVPGSGEALSVEMTGFRADAEAGDAAETAGGSVDGGDESAVERFLIDLVTEVKELDRVARRMLAYYVQQGPDTPLNAHFSAGGSGDRTRAYAHNRTLRLAGFVEHAGRGEYDARLTDLVREATDRTLDPDRVERMVERLERAITEE